jgi:RHS repeat-associated protein
MNISGKTLLIGRLSEATRFRLGLASATVLALTGALLVVPPAQAEAKSRHLTGQADKLVTDGGDVAGKGWPAAKRTEVALAAPVWPNGGSKLRSSMKKTIGSSGALAAGASSVEAQVVAREKVPARWRQGVVAEVAATAAGTASVSIDYSAFRYAYGGGWSSRLRLWRLPACALTTPDRADCSATPLASSNNSAKTTVTADVPVTAAASSSTASATTLVALASSASGDSGDFSATPLSSSSTWSAGGSTGGFTWAYPINVPPGISGPTPSISLAYSSASVDGRNAASNNQPSWIGEGFDYSPGFIERRYVACNDDKTNGNNPAQTADLCWRSDNATMSLGDSSTELIYETGKGWHGRSEDGTKIEKLTGATNGDNDGEHWKVTASDGTQYFFGLNNLTGQSAQTNSTWTVPVYSNQDNEPEHAATFAGSRVTQAWRWNLDYAIDPYGNTLSLWYDKETNKYAAEATDSKVVSYDRGGALARIDYGTWDRGSADRSVNPQAQVIFDPDNRCLADCTTHDAAHWPDTPWDQECKAATCSNYSPTFWSTKRLAKIHTRVWDTTGETPRWQDVESYTLTHSFPSPGDGQKGGLWLDSIVRTGLVGDETPMPAVTFDPVAKPNRVLTKTNTTNNWQRLANIHTETGALIQVTYSNPQCTAQNLPASPQANTKLCYPVKGPDPLSTSGGDLTEWWHKYVVTHVSQTDVQLADAHQAPVINTYYEYEGTPAWHYADDDGLSKAKYKTWDQFRGYASVITRVGDTDQTMTRTTYLRGMHGDRAAPSGGTRSVTVAASLGTETVYDEDEFAGMTREQVLYNGTENKPVSKTVNVPWRSTAKASRTINGDTATARFTNIKTTYAGTALGTDGSAGWRVTSQTNTIDDTYGALTSTQDNGDVANTGDEKCSTTSYNRNTTKNILTLVKQKTITTLACGTAPTSTDHVISDTRTFYDGATSVDTAPTTGNPTRVDTLKGWTPTAGTTWLTLSTATFDAYGRQITGTDTVRGNTTTTAFTPANALVTKQTDTNQQGWTTTEEIYPYWGTPGKITDTNGRVREATYDALGRTANVWDAGWTRAAHKDQPLTKYTYYYSPTRNTYPYVKTEALNPGGGTNVSYQIYDGLLRPRQTQKVAVGGNRVLTDTIYDAYGRVEMGFPQYAAPGEPSGTLRWTPEGSVPAQQLPVYDRAGRTTASIFRGDEAGGTGTGGTNLVEKWRTTTTYQGDRTTVTPPQGATPTTTITDALGHTLEVREYTTASGTSGTFNATKYTYNGKDQLTTVTDTAGDQWSYKYDIRGRQIESVDPDAGKTAWEYNDAGDLTKTTDARGEVLVRAYDTLGRPTITYDDAAADTNKRVELKYDRLYTGASIKGQLTEAIRYDNGNAYKWQARGFNLRDQLTSDQYVIPTAETGLAGTYGYGYGYSLYTGTPTSISYPIAGDLTSEGVTTNYDQTYGLPTSLTSGWTRVGSYVTQQTYTAYGEPLVTQMSIAQGVYVEQSASYELDTRRIHQVAVQPETAAGTVADRTYNYDSTGNILSIKDAPQVGDTDTQCFSYDQLRRLTSAWTPQSNVNCAAAPAVANLGGPAPYWYDWTIDRLGNRTKQVQHTASGDISRDYQVPTAGPNVARPHAVTSLTTTQPGQSTGTTATYDYDNSGNMTTRPGTADGQVLTWDAEGHLAKVVEGTSTTTNLYDANGTRLLRRDAGGATLYLPGQEVRRNGTGSTATVTGTRYYSFAGSTIASRSTGEQSLTWLFDDHQGTQQLALNAYDQQQITIRRQTPYGEPRGAGGSSPLWPNGKGFVGGDNDPTGLTHLGAREYDPVTGRFISVDPLQDLADPQQWNGYAYANNNPTSMSDPTGLMNPIGNRGDQNHNPCDDACQDKAREGNGSGGGKGKIRVETESRSDNSTNTRVCVTGINMCLDQYDVTDVNKYIDSYNAAVAKISKRNGGRALEDFQYLEAMLAGCAADDKHLQAYCSSQSYLTLHTIASEASIVAREEAKGVSAGDATLFAGFTYLQILMSRVTPCDMRVMFGGGGRQSFSEDTLVLLGDGKTTKKFKDIEVGDEVLAADPETGEQAARKVTDVWVHKDDLYSLLVDGEQLTTTEDHPFWNATDQRWERADELDSGDLLQTPAGALAHVSEFRQRIHEVAAAYNLTVEGLHTYYVLAGKTPVLVHNDDPAPIPRANDPKLQNFINALYKARIQGVDISSLRGDGTSMASASSEVNGQPSVWGRNHPGSTAEYAKGIWGWSNANPNASAHDRQLASSLLDAIGDAQNGKYKGFGSYPGLGGC